MVETSWTGVTRVEHRSGHVYILYAALSLQPLLYGDDAIMIS